MTRRTALRIAALSLALAAIALVLLRPLTVFSAGRDLYLFAIGVRGRYVQVGPHRIHYLVAGEGPPLLLVQGVAMRAADFAPLFRTLAREHRVYAPDLLGYGDSDKPRDSDYSVATQTGVVRGFLDAAGLERTDVMGVSMGGWIAMKLAAEDPARVGKLVLVSTAGLTHQTSLNELSFSARTIPELRASLALQTDRAGMIPWFVLRDLLRQSKKRAWIVRASMRSMLAGRDVVDGKLRNVRMPVLVLWGTSDRIVPYALASRLQRELPQARVVPLEDCGHLAIIECRSKALPPILEFLR